MQLRTEPRPVRRFAPLRDIFLNNREAVLEILQRFNEDLTALQRAIRRSVVEAKHA